MKCERRWGTVTQIIPTASRSSKILSRLSSAGKMIFRVDVSVHTYPGYLPDAFDL